MVSVSADQDSFKWKYCLMTLYVGVTDNPLQKGCVEKALDNS